MAVSPEGTPSTCVSGRHLPEGFALAAPCADTAVRPQSGVFALNMEGRTDYSMASASSAPESNEPRDMAAEAGGGGRERATQWCWAGASTQRGGGQVRTSDHARLRILEQIFALVALAA